MPDEAALVDRTKRQRVLDDDIVDAGLAKPAAKLGHPLHVESREVGVVERLRALDLVSQLGDELFFLVLFIARYR